MAEEKKRLERTEGFYFGNELLGYGTNKEGKAWTRFKAKFRPSMESGGQFSFTVFSPLKAKNTKQLEELKAGERYTVLFSSEDRVNEAGQEYTSKTAIGFYHPTEGKDTPKEKVSQVAPTIPPSRIDLSQFEVFKVDYLALCKNKGIAPTPVHMLGSFIATKEGERVAELVTKCKEAI